MPDEILLLGYPVQLGAERQEHLDGVVREFQLITMSTPEARSHLPARLLALLASLISAYAEELAGPDRAQQQALLAGALTVDLRYPVLPETADVVRAWSALLAEVDDYCHAGDLLVMARPPEVVALDAWVHQQMLGQVAGEEPTSWADSGRAGSGRAGCA